MPQHRRLTRPSSIHGLGYWQDTDPTLDGEVAEGACWFDTSQADIIMKLWEGDEWIVAPGGGSIKAMAFPVGNGSIAVPTGPVAAFELMGAGEFVAWRVIDVFETPTTLEFDIWVAASGIPDSGDSIISANPPELSAAQDSDHVIIDPDDWTEAWVSGSLCSIVVAASAGCTGGTLQLFYKRTGA